MTLTRRTLMETPVLALAAEMNAPDHGCGRTASATHRRASAVSKICAGQTASQYRWKTSSNRSSVKK